MRDVVLCRKVDGQIQSMQEFLVCNFYCRIDVFFCILCTFFSAISRGGVKMSNEFLRLCDSAPPGGSWCLLQILLRQDMDITVAESLFKQIIDFELSHSGGAAYANSFAST